MPAQRGQIRIHGRGEFDVELVIAYLSDLRHAYNSILVFEVTVDGLRAYRESGYPFYPGSLFPFSPSAIRRMSAWPPTAAAIASVVPVSERLVLAHVRLQSPGYWDFIGQLNPFEVLRRYLNDRHEQRKDHEYRESAEERKLKLENLKLKNEVIEGRIKLAKQLGATDHDLAPLLNELVYRPLESLDRHQDKGIIENVEVRSLPDKPLGGARRRRRRSIEL
jgi:hypothetical protein